MLNTIEETIKLAGWEDVKQCENKLNYSKRVVRR